MQINPTRKLFVNLAVHDLPRSIEFFTQLGFRFNPQFTNDTATCMIINDHAFVMLLTEDKFEEFARKRVADASRTTEAILALEVGSRSAVDDFVNGAFEAGGARATEPMDESFMYGRSFYDLDGHHWEVFAMAASTRT